MNPEKLLNDYLTRNSVGRYLNMELDHLTYTKIYCSNCKKSKKVFDEKYQNTKIICREQMGCIGDCNFFYPVDDITERLKKLIQSKPEEFTYKKEVDEKMKGKLRKGIEIPDGVHEGTIVSEDLREQEFQGQTIRYLDFKVSMDDVDKDQTVKFGVPYTEEPTERSQFGKLLSKLGVDLDSAFNTEKDVIGKKIRYQTTTDDKGYAKVVLDTIKGVLMRPTLCVGHYRYDSYL